MTEITKVGLAVMNFDRLLLVRKQATGYYILPGGKPENDEDDFAVLAREVNEELACAIDPGTVRFMSAFSDEAAGHAGMRVRVRLYAGALIGEPRPQAEIDDLLWVSLNGESGIKLAPSLRNSILPYLCRLRQSPHGVPLSDGPDQGVRRTYPSTTGFIASVPIEFAGSRDPTVR